MKTRVLFQTALFAVSVALTPTGRTQGTIYVSNLNQPSLGGADISVGLWIAQQFTTGTDAPGYSLSQVRLLMARNTPSPSGFSLSIYDAVRGVGYPSRQLAQLAGPPPSGAGVYAYTAPSLALLPNTIYWVVAAATSPYYAGAYAWDVAATGSYDSASGWRLQSGYAYSVDEGGNWAAALIETPLQFELTATVIPEPSAPCFLGLAALAVVARRSIRRKMLGITPCESTRRRV